MPSVSETTDNMEYFDIWHILLYGEGEVCVCGGGGVGGRGEAGPGYSLK